MYLVLMIASYKDTGLKALSQPRRVLANPSMKNIINLCFDTSVTMTTILWNFEMHASIVPSYSSCSSSLKCIFGSFLSNRSINICVKSKHEAMQEWPNVTSPWYHQSWASPSKCSVANSMTSISNIGLSWKYVSNFWTYALAVHFDEPSKEGIIDFSIVLCS